MKEVKLPDEGGDTMKCIEHNGCILPPMSDPRGIEFLNSVNIRDDDILICSYPKSGTHWIFEMTRELLSGVIINDNISKANTFMEMKPEEAYGDLPSPRILNSHVLMEQPPGDVIRKKIKIIYVLRNPKDVAVSFYNFVKSIPVLEYSGKWENYLRSSFLGKLMYGSWFDYVNHWEAVKTNHPDLPIITLFYEDFKQDQPREMKKLCEFLGVEGSDEFLSRVCENTSLANMRSQKSDQIVYRKGQIGDWKNWFTVAQNEWFDQLYQEKMKDCQLKFKFTEEHLNGT